MRPRERWTILQDAPPPASERSWLALPRSRGSVQRWGLPRLLQVIARPATLQPAQAESLRALAATSGRDLDKHRCVAAGPLAVGHVPPCRHHRKASDDRPRRGLARDLDGLARQMARTAGGAQRGEAGSTVRPVTASGMYRVISSLIRASRLALEVPPRRATDGCAPAEGRLCRRRQGTARSE